MPGIDEGLFGDDVVESPNIKPADTLRGVLGNVFGFDANPIVEAFIKEQEIRDAAARKHSNLKPIEN